MFLGWIYSTSLFSCERADTLKYVAQSSPPRRLRWTRTHSCRHRGSGYHSKHFSLAEVFVSIFCVWRSSSLDRRNDLVPLLPGKILVVWTLMWLQNGHCIAALQCGTYIPLKQSCNVIVIFCHRTIFSMSFNVKSLMSDPKKKNKTRGKSKEKKGCLLTRRLTSLLCLLPSDYHQSTPLAVVVPPFHFYYLLYHNNTILIILAIRRCVAWSSTLITLNHSERRKPRKLKEPYAQSHNSFLHLNPVWAISTTFAVLSPSFSWLPLISILSLKPHPSSIPTPSVWVCDPPLPCSFLLLGGP